MKIKELLEFFRVKKEKVMAARRIKNCSSLIKKAIAHFTEKGELDPVSISVDYPNGEGYIVISSMDLVQHFGMSEMEALLFMDAVLKADKKTDKSELSLLLGRLSVGEHLHSGPVPEAMMEKIKNNNPIVWKEYQRICEEEQKKHGISNEETNALMEEEFE